MYSSENVGTLASVAQRKEVLKTDAVNCVCLCEVHVEF